MLKQQISLLSTKEQKIIKPKVEDVIAELFYNENAIVVLDFVNFIQGKKLSVKWSAHNRWVIRYKGKQLGQISLFPNFWRYGHNNSFLDGYYKMEDCDLKTFAFDNIYTRDCGKCLPPYAQKVKYMEATACTCGPLRIFNPDEESLEQMKQLVEFRINYIKENT